MEKKKGQAGFLVGKLSGQELLSGLAEGRAPLKTRFLGFAKASAAAGHVAFSPNGSCSRWVDIPVSLIEEAEIVGDARCKDHEHAVVRLTIDTSGAGATVSQMLRRLAIPQVAMRMPLPDPADCHYDPLTEEFICVSPGGGGEPDDLPGEGGDQPGGGEDPLDVAGQLLTLDAAASNALSVQMVGPGHDIARDVVSIGISTTDHRGVPWGGVVTVRTISKPPGSVDLELQSVSPLPKGKGFAEVLLRPTDGTRIARGSYIVGLGTQSGNERGETVVSFDVGVLRLGLACTGATTEASVGDGTPEALLLTMCVEDIAAGLCEFDIESLEVFVIEKPSSGATLETSEAIDMPQLGFYRVFLIASNANLTKPIERGGYSLGVKVRRGGAQGFGVVSFVVSD